MKQRELLVIENQLESFAVLHKLKDQLTYIYKGPSEP